MASITRHGDGWRAFVYRNGIRRTKTFGTKREATEWASREESSLTDAKRTSRFTLQQAVDEYVRTRTSQKRSQTWEKNTFGRLVAHFGDRTMIGAIDTPQVSEWVNNRLRTVSGSTVQREANLLRNLFKVARAEWKWIDHDPFQGVRLPAENAPRHQVWTWQLIKRVLRAERTGKTAEVQQAFHIALHTGLRLSEVLSGKYQPATRVIELERTKTGGRVLVPVTRRAAKLLPARFTVGPNEASTLFSKLTDELLIDGLTFHDARASALTWLSRRMDVMTLARISRHRDLRILLSTYYRESAEQIAARI